MKWLALLGVAGVGVWRAVDSFPILPRQGYGLLVLGGAAVAVPLAIYKLMPEAWTGLRRRKEVFVPLGLRVLVLAVAGLLVTWPALRFLVDEFQRVSLGAFTTVLSTFTLLVIFVHAAYAAWVTPLLLRAARGEDAQPRALLPGWRKILRALLLLAFGTLVLLLPFMSLPTLPPDPGVLVGFAAWSILWNLATCALLPVGLDGDRPILAAIRRGFRAGRRHWRLFWKPVVAQLLLAGLFVYTNVSYTKTMVETEWEGDTVRTKRTLHSRNRTHHGVHARWFGGYGDDCDWYEQIMEQVDQKGSPILGYLLMLLYSVLALAVKWTIIARLPAEEEP